MSRCDMQVRIRDAGAQRLLDPYRQCKRAGRYVYTDRFGETWVFCRQHFDAYRAEQ